MPATISIFNPTAPAAEQGRLARRTLPNLNGKTVAFIDNSKPNFNFLADDLGDLLTARFGVKSVFKHRKRTASLAVEPAVLDELASHCDLIITGSGD